MDSHKLLTFEILKNEYFGIRVVFAKKEEKSYAVVTDVNPASECYKEKVEPGDLLLEVNGECIYSLHSLSKVASIPVGFPTSFIFLKGGAKAVDGLMGRCILPACSDLCKSWDNFFIERKERDLSFTMQVQQVFGSPVPITFKPAKKAYGASEQGQIDAPAAMAPGTLSSQKNVIPVGGVSPVVHFQKANPMKNPYQKQSKSPKYIPASTLNRSHVIAPPQALFITRPGRPSLGSLGSRDTRVGRLTQAKSLTDLSPTNSDPPNPNSVAPLRPSMGYRPPNAAKMRKSRSMSSSPSNSDYDDADSDPPHTQSGSAVFESIKSKTMTSPKISQSSLGQNQSGCANLGTNQSGPKPIGRPSQTSIGQHQSGMDSSGPSQSGGIVFMPTQSGMSSLGCSQSGPATLAPGVRPLQPPKIIPRTTIARIGVPTVLSPSRPTERLLIDDLHDSLSHRNYQHSGNDSRNRTVNNTGYQGHE